MRVCFFILNVFDYDSRARLICNDILAAGWQLDIIATTGGKLSNFEGAPIHAIPQKTWPSRKRRFIDFNLQAAKIASRLNADIYHAVDLDTLWAATQAAKKTGGKVLYESRELYTELLALTGRSIIKILWKYLEQRLIHRAAAVVTINNAIAGELARRYNIAVPEVVMNVAPKISANPSIDLKRKFDLNYKYILIYQGILRPGQGILRALEIIANLPEVGLVIVGDGPLKAEISAKAEILGIQSRLRFAGMVTPDELACYTTGADAGLLLMEPVALNNRLALPQKLFQYIAAGVPPIVTALPCLRQIVQDNNAGLVLPETATDSDSRMVWEFLVNGLENARERCNQIKDKYCWEIEGKKLIRVYESLQR